MKLPYNLFKGIKIIFTVILILHGISFHINNVLIATSFVVAFFFVENLNTFLSQWLI